MAAPSKSISARSYPSELLEEVILVKVISSISLTIFTVIPEFSPSDVESKS